MENNFTAVATMDDDTRIGPVFSLPNQARFSGNRYSAPAYNHIIDKYANGVEPIYKYYDKEQNKSISVMDQIRGKSIDYFEYDPTSGNTYIGFTDGTFIIRIEYTAGGIGYDSATYVNTMWCPLLQTEFVLDSRENYDYDSRAYTDENPRGRQMQKITITPFGEWLKDHTNIDVKKLYEDELAIAEERYKSMIANDIEDDRKQYEKLKARFEK